MIKRALTLALASLFYSCQPAPAATVIYSAEHFSGTRNNRAITIRLESQGIANGTNIIFGTPVVVQPIGGLATNTLRPANYSLSIDGVNKLYHFSVPDSTDTYNIIDLINTNLMTLYPSSSQVLSAGSNITLTATGGVLVVSAATDTNAISSNFVAKAGGTMTGRLTNLFSRVDLANSSGIVTPFGSLTYGLQSGDLVATNTQWLGYLAFVDGLSLGSGAVHPTGDKINLVASTGNINFAGIISGNGSGLSNVTASSANAVSGSVSNAFIGVSGGTGLNTTLVTPSIARPWLTNPIVRDEYSKMRMEITNVTTPNGPAIAQDFVMAPPGYTNIPGVIIQFSATPGDAAYGRIWVNPNHDASPFAPGPSYSEAQITFPHHMAIAAGYGSGASHIQWNAGGGQYSYPWGAMWQYQSMAGPYADGNLTATNPLGYSVAFTYRADLSMRGYRISKFPGHFAQGLVTNATRGIYSLDQFGDLGNSYDENGGWSDQWNAGTVRHHNRWFDGDYQGSLIGGGMSYTKTNLTQSAQNLLLDLANFDTWDYTTLTNSLIYTLTNRLSVVLSNNTISKATFIVRARGQIVTNSFPGTWNTNTTGLPATIPAGWAMRLRLEQLAPGGDTNVWAVAENFKDNTFAWDADAVALLSRVGGVTTSMSNIINNWFIDLKSAGAYTNLDWAYPMCFANAASNRLNAISTSYTLSYSGTINTNDASGIHFDGSSGYADTGWQQTDQNHVNFYMCVKVEASPSNAWPLGIGTGSTKFLGFRHNGNPTSMDVFVPQASAGFVTTLSSAVGFHSVSLNSSTTATYTNSVSGIVNTPLVTSSPGAFNLYLGCRNYENVAGNFWGGKMQGACGGNKSMTFVQQASVIAAYANLNTALGR